MDSRISSYFFFILLLVVVVTAAFIFLPFLTPLMLAMAASVVVYPVHRRLIWIFGKSSFGRTVAALLTVVLVVFVALVPLFFLTGSIYAEVQSLYSMLIDEGNRSQVVNALNNASQTFSNLVFNVLPAKSFDSFNVTAYLQGILSWIFSNLDAIFSGMAKVAGYALVFLLALFYFLRDGHELKLRFISWSPLLDSNDEYITRTLKRAIRSVFAGTLAVSLIDGIVIGIAFAVFGIPAPALWGVVTAVAALVPGFGITLVIWPAAAYLVLSGNYIYAIGLLIWGYLDIIVVDHMIGPALVNRGLHIHPFLILLSILGGLLTFGIVGFIMGPMILVILFTLLEIYRTTFNRAGFE